jgi:hypothetical protein
MNVKPTKRWKSPILRLPHIGIASRSRNQYAVVTVDNKIGAALIARFYAVAA